MQTRSRQTSSTPVVVEEVLCQYCGRNDFKSSRGLAMHLRRSNCAEQYEQYQAQAQVSASSTTFSLDSLIARPLLITVENLFAVVINVPNFINNIKILYGHVNTLVDISVIFGSICNGCMFMWTLCTAPDNISTPFLPNSIQPYWDTIYGYLNMHVDMDYWSGRLFNMWKFLVTPTRVDPEAIYAKIENNPNIPSWAKVVFIRLGKVVELLIGAYLLNKMLLWSFRALIACILFTYLSLKDVIVSRMN
ncbi:hypothetical protein MBANPS3_003016 [Mucor bainieri]